MPAVFRDRPGVPIAAVGVWLTSTGEWDCTAEQLRDAVVAQHDPAFRTPVLKLGHTDRRFTDGELMGDGQPAVGRLENLRLSPNGQQLLADLVGIPAPLDDILDTAYPSRSIECFLDVQTAAGGRYAMVVTGLALLGETVPAIETLGDLADLFGVPTDVAAYVAASRIAASTPTTPEDLMPPRALGQVVASASIDELARAAEDWAETQDSLCGDTWVRDIGTDWLVFSCWKPGGESDLYQVSWSESDGVFTFGAPVKVRPTYEPAPVPLEPIAASRITAGVGVVSRHAGHPVLSGGRGTVLSGRGRDVTAGAHPSGVNVSISPALAELLGVDKDADEAAVEAAAKNLRDKADAQPPAPQANTQEGGTTDTPAPTADVEQLVSAAVERVTAKYGAVIESLSSKIAATEAEKAAATKSKVIGDAVAAGKIAPADREAWEKDYDESPAVVASLLGRIARGTAVPVTASGVTGAEHSDASFSDAEYDRLFGATKAGA